MNCPCGYSFSENALRKARPYESFAVVADKDYQKFLRSEMKVLEATKEQKLAAISRSARYVGTLQICPECGHAVLLMPGSSERRDFAPEK